MVIFSCLFIQPIQAAVWENLPVFPGAQRFKQEEIDVNGLPAQTAIYTTTSSDQEVADFYQTKMVNFGWKQESQTSQQGIVAMAFSKKDKVATLMYQQIMGRNFITLTQSSMRGESASGAGAAGNSNCPDCAQSAEDFGKKLGISSGQEVNKRTELPSAGTGSKETDASLLEDTPGIDIKTVPRYPGAVRVNSFERGNGKKINIAYLTQASVSDVLAFYANNMETYNWTLDNTVDLQDMPKGLAEQVNVNFKGKSLVFKNDSASCIINVFKEPQGMGTIIGINYNEK